MYMGCSSSSSKSSSRGRGAAGAGAARGAAGAGAAGGAAGAGAAGGAAGAGAAGGAAGAGATGGAAGSGAAGAAGPGGARTGGTGAAGAGGTAGVGATGTEAGGAAGVVTRDPGAKGTGAVSANSGGAAQPRLPQPVQSESQLQPSSPLPSPSPYSGPTRGLTERREPESRLVSPVSRAASPVRTAHAGRVLRPHPPLVSGTHSMTLRPSTSPQRVPLPSHPASSLPDDLDSEFDSLRAASPTVLRFLATAVTDPLFESTAASALTAELVNFAAACCLDFATSLVAESASASVCPPSIGDPDAPDIPTLRSYAEAIEGPYSSQWQAAMDAEMASWKSTGTYVDEVPPPGANIAPREWHDTRRTTLAALGFSPCTADPLLFLRTDTTLLPFYVLVYADDLVFATADTEALAHVKSELQKRHTCTEMESTPLPTGHSLSAPPSDESVEPSGPCPELVGCLMYLMTCTQPDLAYPLSLLARYVARDRHRKVHWDAAKRVLRYLCSTSGMGLVLGGRA
ncbi:unnamed protein product [Closterium sp. NIES-54]